MKSISIKLFSILFLLIAFGMHSFAQKETVVHNKALDFSFGRSFHGSGDLGGASFATRYTKYFRRRFSWTAAVGASIHDGADPMTLIYDNGSVQDISVRYTTAGFQGLAGVGYSLVRSNRHEAKAVLSTLFRYQSSSFTGRTVYFPAATGLPFPVVLFENKAPARTYSVGASLTGAYNYTFKNSILTGFSVSLQKDFNSDVLQHFSLVVGKRF